MLVVLIVDEAESPIIVEAESAIIFEAESAIIVDVESVVVVSVFFAPPQAAIATTAKTTAATLIERIIVVRF